jgi:hypothetical protein
MSQLLSCSCSIIGLLLVTVSSTGICQLLQAASYVSFNLKFIPPSFCCSPAAKAKAAAASQQALTLLLCTQLWLQQQPAVHWGVTCVNTVANIKAWSLSQLILNKKAKFKFGMASFVLALPIGFKFQDP